MKTRQSACFYYSNLLPFSLTKKTIKTVLIKQRKFKYHASAKNSYTKFIIELLYLKETHLYRVLVLESMGWLPYWKYNNNKKRI